jgi:hypothetical protein
MSMRVVNSIHEEETLKIQVHKITWLVDPKPAINHLRAAT